MVKRRELLKFTVEMEKILDEKDEKYKDIWKKISIYGLKNKMTEQIKKLDFDFDNTEDVEGVKRALVHVANYCFFLRTRLEE